eukprot:3074_1
MPVVRFVKMLWYAEQFAVLRAHIVFASFIWLIRATTFPCKLQLQFIQHIHFYIVCLRSIVAFLATKYDYFGSLYSSINIALHNRGIISITPHLYKDMENFEWIQMFSKSMYWRMIYDEYRMRTFNEAAKQVAKNLHFIDIGCGAHLPLTKIVIDCANASLVDAVEGNKNAQISARHIIESDKVLSNRVRLHECYTTELEKNCLSPAPTAIIHEIVGVIASDEGMLNIVADVQKRLLNQNINYKIKSIIIPQLVTTIGYPVSTPQLSFISKIISFVNPGQTYKFDEVVSCTHFEGYPTNFRYPIKLAETAQLEHFDFSINSAENMMITDVTKYYTVIKCGVFSGMIMSCTIQAHPKAYVCNALTSNTNWGAYFIRLVPKKDYASAYVSVGNMIKVRFQSNATDVVPSYSISATIMSGNGNKTISS